MRRRDLAHIVRAASDVSEDHRILVIGSQAILASFDETQLPAEATRSIEADIAFFDDRDERKSDTVDGAIGELSSFHESFGVYGQGVGLATASLPEGWRERLVPLRGEDVGPGEALCLEPHDLVVSKLVAGRPKDRAFARELLGAGLIDGDILAARATTLSEPPGKIWRVLELIDALGSGVTGGTRGDG